MAATNDFTMVGGGGQKQKQTNKNDIYGNQESFVYIKKKSKKENIFLHQCILARPYFMSILQWGSLEVVSKE